MEALELFPKYTIKKPLRLIELFAGYGSQALALENLGVQFEHHQVVEFDKYAIVSYNALHGTDFSPQDITQLEKLDVTDTDTYDYIMTYSFPCTDLSLAVKGLGMKKGTRSGLLWEVERLLAKANMLPQILVMENVRQVHGAKHKEDFDRWVSFLTSLGYSNKWQDLNAKNYGIPQNRVRTFMVSVLGDYEYHFPKPIDLKLRLKDMLEDDVNEKYYLSEKAINGMRNTTYESSNIERRVQKQNGISSTLCARDYKDPKCIVVGYVDPYPLRIRKLTPREYFRLMGLNDNQIDRLFNSGNSNTQLYKQAGNSIVVQVLEEIFKKLLEENYE